MLIVTTIGWTYTHVKHWSTLWPNLKASERYSIQIYVFQFIYCGLECVVELVGKRYARGGSPALTPSMFDKIVRNAWAPTHPNVVIERISECWDFASWLLPHIDPHFGRFATPREASLRKMKEDYKGQIQIPDNAFDANELINHLIGNRPPHILRYVWKYQFGCSHLNN